MGLKHKKDTNFYFLLSKETEVSVFIILFVLSFQAYNV